LLAIDISPSMFYPASTNAKLRFSKYAAAALSYLLVHQRDAVGLCLFSDQVHSLTPVKSTPTHLNKLLRMLEDVERQKPSGTRTEVAGVLHQIAENIHKRSLVVIFSDMFDAEENTDELFKALQHLKHNKHEVIVFHVMDNDTEIRFDFEERPMEFIDLETGEKLRLNPHDVKDQYQEEAQKFHSALKMRCNQYRIDFIEADTKTDFNLILQTYLIKRSKMR
jgi:uncharacterized protein (DUF58 family)